MVDKVYTAIHRVVYGKGEAAEPGTVFTPPTDVPYLLEVGAIREPTEAELAIYEKINGAVADAEPAAGAKGGKKPGADLL